MYRATFPKHYGRSYFGTLRVQTELHETRELFFPMSKREEIKIHPSCTDAEIVLLFSIGPVEMSSMTSTLEPYSVKVSLSAGQGCLQVALDGGDRFDMKLLH
jgi:hypothetical protein